MEPLAHDETTAFLTTLRELSLETPDLEKTSLTGADLPFAAGYKLVTARLHPQITHHENRPGKELSEEHRSCFLYNPTAKLPVRRIIPLFPDEDWINQINRFLGVRIDEEYAVDYLKYYTHVMSDDELLPLDTANDIAWRSDIAETTKTKVRAIIEADLPLMVQRNSSRIPIYEDIFGFVIPALHEGKLCRNKAKVSARGYTEYTKERVIYSNPVFESRNAAPYYAFDFKNVVYATPALRVAGLAQRAFGIVGIAALVLTFIAVINVVSSWLTENPDYLGMRSILPLPYWDRIYDVVLLGTVIYFVIEVVVSVRDGIRWRAAARGPGKLASAWKSMRVEVQSWPLFQRNVWWGLIQYFLFGLMILLCSWSFIVFWGQHEYSWFFASTEPPTLRQAFIYALAQFLEPYLFWVGPPQQYYGAPFDQPPTFLGRFLPWLIPLSVGVVLVRTVYRLFQMLQRRTHESS